MEINAKKRPIDIQAYHFNGQITEAIKWSQKFGVGTQPTELIFQQSTNSGDKFFVKSLEGDFNIKMGDYIIRGIKGEFYVCDKEIFETTYDIAQQPTPVMDVAPVSEPVVAAQEVAPVKVAAKKRKK